MNSYYTDLQAAIDSLSIAMKPKIAMIIGSGLGGLLDDAKILQRIPYTHIEGFPKSSAPSHKGELLVALFSGVPVLVFNGRVHLYEGCTAQQVAMPVYLSCLLDIDKLIVTNAAGALNQDFVAGRMMLVDDHINLTGQDPTSGLNDEWLGPRFTDMSNPYSSRLRDLWLVTAEQQQQGCQRGIYVGVHGPSLETSAERRMMRLMGADAVGMSSVLEVIAANHCGIEVIGVSAISNMAVGDEQQQPDTIDDVLLQAKTASIGMARVLHLFLKKLTSDEHFLTSA